jgi:hypothetical protein
MMGVIVGAFFVGLLSYAVMRLGHLLQAVVQEEQAKAMGWLY